MNNLHIDYLKLNNFRNYRSGVFVFSPGVNVLRGKNGQGKTNVLEAIHLLSTGRSFRTHRLQEMIREGESFFSLEAHFSKQGVGHTLKLIFDGQTRTLFYNETPHAHFSDLLGIVPSVLLCPDDLAFVSGAPAERRRFLDLALSQIDPLYFFYLMRYTRAMRQRNTLLRGQNDETLSAWEQVMAPSADYLIAKRISFAAELEQPASEWMRLFSESETLALSYAPSHGAAPLLAQWQKMRMKEMRYGTTLIGPHRDDLAILLSQRSAKQFSSEGQKRSLLTSLRFAQWQQMQERLDAPPLLAIDDFGIQLDPARQEVLCSQLSRFGQVFLSTPHPSSALSGYHTFHIQDGSITCLK